MAGTKTRIVTMIGWAIGVVSAGVLTYGVLAAAPQKDDAPKPSNGNKTEAALAARLKEVTRAQLELTQRELAQLHSDMRKARAELAFWEARDKKIASLPIPDSAVDERLSQDPAILRVLNKINELKNSIAEVKSVSAPGKNDGVIKELQDQVAANEKTLAALRQLLKPQLVEQLRQKAYDEFRGRITQFKEQIEFGEEFEKTLKADLQRLTGEAGGATAGGSDPRVGALEKEVRELREAVEELKKKK